MELRHYYEILRRRAWIVALLTIVVVGGVVYQVTSLTPKYEAEVSMLVTPRVTAPTAFEDTGPSTFPGAYREAVLRNIALLIQSREVLERVARKVEAVSGEDVRRRLQVTEVRGSDFLIVNAKHDQPERAALIANTAAQEFVSYYVQINRAEATTSASFIQDQLRRAQERLRTAEAALLDFRRRTGVVGLPEGASRIVQRALDIQATYDTAALEERMARSRIEAVQERLRSQNDARLSSVSIATNPVVGQLRVHLTTLELELASLRQVNTDQHPKVKELLGRVADARQRLKDEAAKVVKDESLGVSPIREQLVREMVTTEFDAVVAQTKATGTLQLLNKMRIPLGSIPQNELASARLERDVRIAEEDFVRLSSLHQDAVIRESKAGSSGQAAIVLVDLAKVPDQPVSTQLPFKAGFAGLVGLIVGAAMALLIDGMDDRIRSSRQAEGAYGVPVLAAVPVMSVRTHRALTERPRVPTLLFPTILVIAGLASGVGLSSVSMMVRTEQVMRSALAVIQTFSGIP